MKLELSTSKRCVTRASQNKEEIVFTVLDLDKGETYPKNFVCILPKTFEKGENNSNFQKIFGKTSQQIAIKLLNDALKHESDPEVKVEIEKRLKDNLPKPFIKVTCIDCGCVFEAKKSGRYVQRICQPCKMKIRRSS